MKCLAFVVLIGCTGGERASTGQCPAGETCSPRTPYGLHFLGSSLVDDVVLAGPVPTAIGGTQDVGLAYDPGTGIMVALDLPFEAVDDGGGGVTVARQTGSVVTVRGAGSRTNYLRVLDASDGRLFDRKQLTGAAIDTIELVATDGETVPAGQPLAWATGDQQLGVALYGQVQESSGPTSERLVDTSMQLVLPGAEHVAWDTLHLPGASAGSYAISVTAGDRPAASIELVVVDHADAVAAISPAPTTAVTNGTTQVCFAATAATRFVVGFAWAFVVDGTAQAGDPLEPNCVLVSTKKTSGTLDVAATAGGRSATVTLTVSATATRPPTTPRPQRATAGDRAAM